MEAAQCGQLGRKGGYLTGSEAEPVPRQVLAWQREVHRPGIYDLAVDTSMMTPDECAALIRKRLEQSPWLRRHSNAGQNGQHFAAGLRPVEIADIRGGLVSFQCACHKDPADESLGRKNASRADCSPHIRL